jgi:hypothetical protein
MQDWKRGASSVASLAMVALLVAACSPTSRTNTANLNVVGPAPQASALPNSTVQTNSLPPIGATGTPAPGLSGQPVLGGAPTQTAMVGSSLPPMTGGTTTTMGGNSSIVSVGTPAATGMASTGAMTTPAAGGPEGTWNVVAGAQSCQINLPRTAKDGTNYFRASAPGCAVPQIAGVTGWQQVGSQLQLYDDNGNIAAFMAPSGGRYIGTISGGQAVSMSR